MGEGGLPFLYRFDGIWFPDRRIIHFLCNDDNGFELSGGCPRNGFGEKGHPNAFILSTTIHFLPFLPPILAHLNVNGLGEDYVSE
jgi:hypothetical protein